MTQRYGISGPLTADQKEILRRLAGGLHFREVEADLYLAEDVANRSMERARKKLKARTTMQVVALFVRAELLREKAAEFETQADKLQASGIAPEGERFLRDKAASFRYEAEQLNPSPRTPLCVHGRMLTLEECRRCTIRARYPHTFQGTRFRAPRSGQSCHRCLMCGQARKYGNHKEDPS